MVDNVSFIDEVNTLHRLNNSVPRDGLTMVSAAAAADQDNSNTNNNNSSSSNNNNNSFIGHNNNNQQLVSSPEDQWLQPRGSEIEKRSGSRESVNSHFHKSKYKCDNNKDGFWLSRSVTQPNLGSTTNVSLPTSVVSSCTQSEKNILEVKTSSSSNIGLSNYWESITTPLSAMSSSPNSYDALPGDVTGEYFDARSSFSAPVELLSEFLSALMSRDYETALNLCQSILKYEPHNATAQEFYPLLISKINQISAENQTTTDEDTDTNTDEEEEEEEEEEEDDDKDEQEKRKGKITTICKSQVDNAPHPPVQNPRKEKKKKKKDGGEEEEEEEDRKSIVSKTKTFVDQSSSLGSFNMSASNSMDLSAGIDSGRESLFNDSDVNLESGDSLYSSLESNLNMIRSGSDSLFSSTESGLTLESVVKSFQKLATEGQSAV